MKSNKQHASVYIVALECVSLLVCPVYGDFYSFPWKRGPHDNINEYVDANITFDALRQNIYNQIKDSDFVDKALQVYLNEDENAHIEVKCSILRLFI